MPITDSKTETFHKNPSCNETFRKLKLKSNWNRNISKTKANIRFAPHHWFLNVGREGSSWIVFLLFFCRSLFFILPFHRLRGSNFQNFITFIAENFKEGKIKYPPNSLELVFWFLDEFYREYIRWPSWLTCMSIIIVKSSDRSKLIHFKQSYQVSDTSDFYCNHVLQVFLASAPKLNTNFFFFVIFSCILCNLLVVSVVWILFFICFCIFGV